MLLLLLAGLAPSLVVLAAGVVADPPVARDTLLTVPISKRINYNGIYDLTKRDREHFTNLVKRGGGHRRQSSNINKIPSILINNTGIGYVATIAVGSPPTNYRLLVDSGSAITWIGANKPYAETESSVKTKETLDITYSVGSFQGPLYNDTVTISGIPISQQYIGVASNSTGFSPLDGILGIGPNDLTLGLLKPDTNMIARTVTDSLFHQGLIQKNQVAVSLLPTKSFPIVNGELTFGGFDSTKFIGELDYFPLAHSSPANQYWSTDATFRYGNQTIFNSAPGVFDTGTALFGLATDAYNLYVKATGAVFDKKTGLLMIHSNQYKKLQPLFINILDRTYEFNANAQIWPRALNSLIGGNDSFIYLIINDLGEDLSKEMSFVAGVKFLERFYAVFDSRRHRIGLANTQFTDSMDFN